MNISFQQHLQQQLSEIRAAGTYKNERVIMTPQGTTIRVADGKPVLNFCANNYLGLAQHPAVAAAAKQALEEWGYGCASVRFICGTQGVQQQLSEIRAAGTYKNERVIMTPQGTTIRVADGKPVLNFCANNYLGLAQHPAVAAAAKQALEEWGYGCASVRFICGTQGVHKQLEAKLSEFLGTEDTILYSSCFDANGGLFETLLGPEDAIISDELNHASIIDGVRL